MDVCPSVRPSICLSVSGVRFVYLSWASCPEAGVLSGSLFAPQDITSVSVNLSVCLSVCCVPRINRYSTIVRWSAYQTGFVGLHVHRNCRIHCVSCQALLHTPDRRLCSCRQRIGQTSCVPSSFCTYHDRGAALLRRSSPVSLHQCSVYT